MSKKVTCIGVDVSIKSTAKIKLAKVYKEDELLPIIDNLGENLSVDDIVQVLLNNGIKVKSYNDGLNDIMSYGDLTTDVTDITDEEDFDEN